MSALVTRNHIHVESGPGSIRRLSPSAFLIAQMGADVIFSLPAAGERITGGEVYGRIEGSRQACHLYAPFSMQVLACDPARGEIEVRAEGAPIEELFDEASYREHLESLPS